MLCYLDNLFTLVAISYTAFQIASYRPIERTYIFISNKHLLNAMSLVWGVRTFYYDQLESTDKSVSDVNAILKAEGLVEAGYLVINTVSAPIFEHGKTNMLKLTIIA